MDDICTWSGSFSGQTTKDFFRDFSKLLFILFYIIATERLLYNTRHVFLSINVFFASLLMSVCLILISISLTT